MDETQPQGDALPDAPPPALASAKISSAQVFCIPLLIAVVALLGVIAFQQRTEERWSYAIVAPKDEDLLKELNQLGAVGYEVVAARRATSDDPNKKAAYEMILKRRGATLLEPAVR